MRVELPGDAWVELRDALKAKDRFAVQDAVNLVVDQERSTQHVSLNVSDQMRLALLGLTITDWSFAQQGIPIPANNPGGTDIIGEVLDLDQYNALEEAIEPLFQKVRGRGGVPNSDRRASA